MSGRGTLLDVLFDAAQEAPEQVIVQVAGDGSEQVQTYAELLDASLRVAGGFRAANLPTGTPVILLAGGTDDFLPSFWGALAAGLVPVPLAPVEEPGDDRSASTCWAGMRCDAR